MCRKKLWLIELFENSSASGLYYVANYFQTWKLKKRFALIFIVQVIIFKKKFLTSLFRKFFPIYYFNNSLARKNNWGKLRGIPNRFCFFQSIANNFQKTVIQKLSFVISKMPAHNFSILIRQKFFEFFVS